MNNKYTHLDQDKITHITRIHSAYNFGAADALELIKALFGNRRIVAIDDNRPFKAVSLNKDDVLLFKSNAKRNSFVIYNVLKPISVASESDMRNLNDRNPALKKWDGLPYDSGSSSGGESEVTGVTTASITSFAKKLFSGQL